MAKAVKMWWDELVKRWLPNDPESPSEAMHAYYQMKYTVAAILQPKRICEIGVRAGYSAFAFLSACPNAHYYGIDNNSGDHGGVKGAYEWAITHVLKSFENVTLEIRDSWTLGRLPYGTDLTHIDGNHSYDYAIHDTDYGLGTGKPVLVDDYDSIQEVRRACDFQARKYAPRFRAIYIDDGFRGQMLFVPK